MHVLLNCQIISFWVSESLFISDMPRKRDRNGKEIRPPRTKQTSGANKRVKYATEGTGKKYAYIFTCNNYTDDDVFHIANATLNYPDEIIYVDFGFEVGESGTPHLQGQIEMNIECM